MSALIAEIPRQTHPMFVDKGDVRANNGFAIGELDDFNEDVLSGKLTANNNGRGCYEEMAQMHGVPRCEYMVGGPELRTALT